MKSTFINSEIWSLTIGGAFQRANVYNPDVLEKDKKDFKFMLKGYIDNTIVPSYNKVNMSDDIHIENIKSVQQYTSNFDKLLTNGQFNFGVSQKLLNLYLKYLWCLGVISEPPHFPVDRIIQQKLKFKPIIAWTKIETSEEYMSIVNFARTKINLKDEFSNSLSVIELNLFSRRND
ncbi:hypothetical protein CLV86_2638 [Lacinutrix venerupis]|uniref:hypothetical protein n=1 Tax=Lacinutrix venerupis TaxID=1486034 RepID=UPI000EAE7481|nr:hypothetical protein [Lacinutrix venerupis]RLJ61615.1 hypothetical protein CLV86_2638 [Lacinutrix venerupis]